MALGWGLVHHWGGELALPRYQAVGQQREALDQSGVMDMSFSSSAALGKELAMLAKGSLASI